MSTVMIVEEQVRRGTADPAAAGGSSAVSWPAILAGATASSALALILLVLGVGLGLSAVSPWAGVGASTTAMSWSAIAWMLVTAFAASGLGGYLAGRLRVRWPGTQQDEVYFRDTAHGFLSWAVAALLTAAVFTSVIAAILGIQGDATPGVQAGGTLTDEARRNAAYASLWMFVSLLLGAFSASWMATVGGRQRDLP